MIDPRLAAAQNRLPQAARVAIYAVSAHADRGDTHLDDLAFAVAIIDAMICEYGQSSVAWCLISAQAVLLQRAVEEGILAGATEGSVAESAAAKALVALKGEIAAKDAELAVARRVNAALDRKLVETDGRLSCAQANYEEASKERAEAITRLERAEMSARCHPGLHCPSWPDCERCGPPRL